MNLQKRWSHSTQAQVPAPPHILFNFNFFPEVFHSNFYPLNFFLLSNSTRIKKPFLSTFSLSPRYSAPRRRCVRAKPCGPARRRSAPHAERPAPVWGSVLGTTWGLQLGSSDFEYASNRFFVSE